MTQLEDTAVAFRPLLSILLLTGFIALSLVACSGAEPGTGSPPPPPPGEFEDPADSGVLGTVDDPMEGGDEDLNP